MFVSMRSPSTPIVLPVLALTAFGAMPAACTQPPVARQVYSNIEVQAETTDATGMEIEWRPGLWSDRVLMVICEGGCRGAEALEASSQGAGLTLLWRDPLADPAQPPERYSFRRSGLDLVVDRPAWAKAQVLKRATHPTPGRTSAWAEY
jgi:hypothetical protein